MTRKKELDGLIKEYASHSSGEQSETEISTIILGSRNFKFTEHDGVIMFVDEDDDHQVFFMYLMYKASPTAATHKELFVASLRLDDPSITPISALHVFNFPPGQEGNDVVKITSRATGKSIFFIPSSQTLTLDEYLKRESTPEETPAKRKGIILYQRFNISSSCRSPSSKARVKAY